MNVDKCVNPHNQYCSKDTEHFHCPRKFPQSPFLAISTLNLWRESLFWWLSQWLSLPVCGLVQMDSHIMYFLNNLFPSIYMLEFSHGVTLISSLSFLLHEVVLHYTNTTQFVHSFPINGITFFFLVSFPWIPYTYLQ